MREVVLDTETTGLDPDLGDRLVEIGCLELFNQVPTGKTFQSYFNPERDVPEAAFRVHGLGNDFLKDKPRFADKADAFLEFIGDAPLVIHNAEFDLAFLNAELARSGRPFIPLERTIDTVKIARQKFPGAPASLDALCKRFMIDNSGRDLHGALLDARLLADVYLMLLGGRQVGLGLDRTALAGAAHAPQAEQRRRPERAKRPHAPSEAELARHRDFLRQLTDPIWND